MYNTEKYIGECLDSIFAQTFQDFEVIVVDDCSTDNSCAIVESYMSKFNNTRGTADKLQLIHSDKNSGGRAGIPRNIGMRLSYGEYIMFVDSDDTITPTALEEIYILINKFDADVIHFGKHYKAPEGTAPTDKRLLREFSDEHIKPFNEPIFESNDLGERIKKFSSHGIWHATVSNVLKRSFIMKNNIFFPSGRVSEDFILIIQLLCLAEKFLNAPNAYYVYRKREGSTSQSKSISPEFHFINYSSPLAKYVAFIDEFMDKFELFRSQPSYKYMVYDFLMKIHFNELLGIYAQIPTWKFDDLLRKEWLKEKDTIALTTFLFNRMNIFNLQLSRQNLMIQQMQAYIQQQNQVIRQLQNK